MSRVLSPESGTVVSSLLRNDLSKTFSSLDARVCGAEDSVGGLQHGLRLFLDGVCGSWDTARLAHARRNYATTLERLDKAITGGTVVARPKDKTFCRQQALSDIECMS